VRAHVSQRHRRDLGAVLAIGAARVAAHALSSRGVIVFARRPLRRAHDLFGVCDRLAGFGEVRSQRIRVRVDPECIPVPVSVRASRRPDRRRALTGCDHRRDRRHDPRRGHRAPGHEARASPPRVRARRVMARHGACSGCSAAPICPVACRALTEWLDRRSPRGVGLQTR
jgi:hypothetical protein